MPCGADGSVGKSERRAPTGERHKKDARRHSAEPGEAGNDFIDGGANDDTSLSGNAGNDRIRGGSGHDTLIGGEGDDQLDGDSGDDILTGDDGYDLLFGDTGVDDQCFGNGGTNHDVLWMLGPSTCELKFDLDSINLP